MQILHHLVHPPTVVLVVVEALAFFGTFYLAVDLRFRFLGEGHVEGEIWPRAVLVTAIMLMCMVATGLYSPRLRVNHIGMLIQIGTSVIAATFAVVLSLYIIDQPEMHIGRGILWMWAPLAFAAAGFIRLAFFRLVNQT